jgi:hypothetical protein
MQMQMMQQQQNFMFQEQMLMTDALLVDAAFMEPTVVIW